MTTPPLIKCFTCGPLATNTFLIACPKSKQAAIIDPGIESKGMLESTIKEEKLLPKMILLTHTHWDHTADVAKIKKSYEIPVMVHVEDAPNLQNPGSDGLPLLFPIEPASPDHCLHDGEIIALGHLSLEVLHIPGHSPGGVAYYEKEEGILFSGDMLFKGSIGNLSLPTAEPEKMWPSLERLAKLPKETVVYPGHGESTTIEDEQWLPNAKEYFT